MSNLELICNAVGVSGKPVDVTELKALCAEQAKSIAPSELSQWISLSQSLTQGDLKGLNGSLATKSYLIGTKFTLADAAVYVALMTVPKLKLDGLDNITRYIDHVQSFVNPQADIMASAPRSSPTMIPLGTAVAKAAPAAAKNEEKNEGAAPAADEKDNAKKEKKEKKEKTPAAAVTVVAAVEELDPSKLDIRVGEIKKCWNHEDSEKLLCEEVDLGEAAVRNIASGIRAFYNADEFVGKKVMVLANLKDRAIAGFKSQGMVLCACNVDHTEVAILEPPAGAKVGDKVQFGDWKGDPISGSQMAKKKVLEKLAPLLKTNEKGEAFCGKDAFTVNGKAVISKLVNGIVS